MGHLFAGATIFNQDLSGWCVTNITSKPTDFATGALISSNYPVWGTCLVPLQLVLTSILKMVPVSVLMHQLEILQLSVARFIL